MSNQHHPELKKAMIAAMESALGVVTLAAKTAGIHRSTHYQWMKDDPAYKASIEELSDVALDFAESQLHKQIQEGQPASTIFYLKTKGKKRGYVERHEITGKDGEMIQINMIMPPD